MKLKKYVASQIQKLAVVGMVATFLTALCCYARRQRNCDVEAVAKKSDEAGGMYPNDAVHNNADREANGVVDLEIKSNEAEDATVEMAVYPGSLQQSYCAAPAAPASADKDSFVAVQPDGATQGLSDGTKLNSVDLAPRSVCMGFCAAQSDFSMRTNPTWV